MVENESQTENSLDYISLENFQKMADMVFGISDMKEIQSLDINKIDKDKIVLLLAWPLVIAKKYLCPYMELDVFKKQYELNKILSNDFDPDKIWNCLSDFNIDKNYFSENSEKIAKLALQNEQASQGFQTFTKLFSNVFEEHEDIFNFKKIFDLDGEKPSYKIFDLVLGGKPDSKNTPFPRSKIAKRIFFTNLLDQIIDCEITGTKLRNGILYYYLILFFIFDSLGLDKKDDVGVGLIDFDDILESFVECTQIFGEQTDAIFLNSLELFSTFGVSLFSDAIIFFIKNYKDIFLKDGFPEESDSGKHQFYKSKPDYIASISRIEGKAGNDETNFKIGVEREIKFLEGMDYIFEFWFERDFSNNEFFDLITFVGDENKGVLKSLVHCLFEMAQRLSIQINKYSSDYNKFVANADTSVDKNLEGFIENIDSIQDSYYLFNEYLEHKDFSRAIETLDMKLVYDCIEETRKDLKKKKEAHLSPKLIQKLLRANNELGILFGHVRGKKREVNRDKLAKEFFENNIKYFDVLEKEDIKEIEFSSDPNGIRDARRKIFHIIASKEGKHIPGYKIAKELATE